MFDRKKHWGDVYQDKSSSDLSWYQKEPKLSLELIRSTNVASNDAIIDIGAGTSVLVDYLKKEHYTNLTVLDISENAITIAKKRLGKSAKSINWIVCDITKFDVFQKFSLWHDRALFHFLTDPSDRGIYVKALINAIRPEGHLIIATFAIGGPKKCSGLEIVQYDSEKIIAELGDNFKLVEEKTEVHITPANKEQKFIFFLFRRVQNKSNT